MTYDEVLNAARTEVGPYCKACPVCDGRACKNKIPGPGAKGRGMVAIRNHHAWQEIRLNMDTITGAGPIDTSLTLFDRTFALPVFAAPIGAMKTHYGEKYSDPEYNDILVAACAASGIAAFTGDGLAAEVMAGATAAIKKQQGLGIPTVKPWDALTLQKKLDQVQASGALAIAMDIDSAGLPFLKNMNPPAGPKSVDELRNICRQLDQPFVLKGIMTPRGARKAREAGAAAIVVSNHGGRVLDGTPATAEVLAEIKAAVGDEMKVLVDGGIRSGNEIFKALALGADAVLIGRPFVTAVYGAGAAGVATYVSKLHAELVDTMMMCGAHTLADITEDMVRI